MIHRVPTAFSTDFTSNETLNILLDDINLSSETQRNYTVLRLGYRRKHPSDF